MSEFDFKLRMPIETNYRGEEITKVCVEDIHKILNRVGSAINRHNKNAKDILKSVRKRYVSAYQDSEGYLIIGRGVSKPCNGDEFNEQTGNNIAFMKAKLNANIKKHNMLVKVYNEFITLCNDIDEDITNVDDYIMSDLENLREFNPSYLEGIEQELGIVDDESDTVEEESDTVEDNNEPNTVKDESESKEEEA